MEKYQDFSSVIDAVENASDKELAALAEISQKLDPRPALKTDLAAPPVAEESRTPQDESRNEQDPVSRSVMAHRRNAENNASKNHQKTIKKPLIEQQSGIEQSGQVKDGVEVSQSAQITHNNYNEKPSKTDTTADAQLPQQKAINITTVSDAKTYYKKAGETSREGFDKSRNGQDRDESGRFKSKSQLAAESVNEKRQAASETDSFDKAEGLISKLARSISDPLESDNVDQAGRAVGSTFWRSGKEIYDIGKSSVTGVTDAIGKVKQLSDVEKDPSETQKGLWSRFRRADKQAAEENAGRKHNQGGNEQAAAIRDGDGEIVDRLDKLIKASERKSGAANRKTPGAGKKGIAAAAQVALKITGINAVLRAVKSARDTQPQGELPAKLETQARLQEQRPDREEEHHQARGEAHHPAVTAEYASTVIPQQLHESGRQNQGAGAPAKTDKTPPVNGMVHQAVESAAGGSPTRADGKATTAEIVKTAAKEGAVTAAKENADKVGVKSKRVSSLNVTSISELPRTRSHEPEQTAASPQGQPARARRSRQQTSQDALARNMAREQERSIKEQTAAIREGDEEIVDRLDQLIKANGKKSGGGIMSSLLGGTALAGLTKGLGKWGKGALFAGGAAVLGGAKTIYDRIRRKPKAGEKTSETEGKNKTKKGPGKEGSAKEVSNKTKPEANEKVKTGTGQGAEKGSQKATKEGAEAAGKKAAKEGAEEAGKKAVKKGAAEVAEAGVKKVGVKTAFKSALKVTGIGTVLSALWDAGEGYSDEDAQKKTFGTSGITTQQKASYATANLLSLGGLGDIASEYAGKGARWLGLDGVADTVEKYNTADIAISLNDSFDKIKNYFSEEKKTEETSKANQAELITAIEKGSTDTTTEVRTGFTALLDLLKHPVETVKGLADGSYSLKSGKVPPLEKALTKEGRQNLDALDEHFKMLEARDGLPANTLRTIATIESSGNPNAVGPETKYGSAKGMFQLVDTTASDLGLSGRDVFDPVKASDAASRYMKYLLKDNGGDLNKAIASYNWGIGNLQKKGMENMPEETRDYIAKYHSYNSAFSAERGQGAVTGNAVPPVALSTPVVPVTTEARQSGADTGNTFTDNGQTYRKAELPTDGTPLSDLGIEQLGGEKIQKAEGMRHQVSAGTLAARSQSESQKNLRPVPAGDYARDANGEIYRRAQLPSDQLDQDTVYGEVAGWVTDTLGGDKLRDAEGMRHQVATGEGSSAAGLKATIASRAAAQVRAAVGQIGVEADGTPIVRGDMVGRAVTVSPKTPLAQIPAKPTVITDYSASQVKPAVTLNDKSVSLDSASQKLLSDINGWLKKIAGHTEDTANAAGKQAPNTPATAQPQPRGSIPLEVSDPAMQEMAKN